MPELKSTENNKPLWRSKIFLFNFGIIVAVVAILDVDKIWALIALLNILLRIITGKKIKIRGIND